MEEDIFSQVSTDGRSQDESSQNKTNKFKLQNGVTMKVTGCGPIDLSGEIKLKVSYSANIYDCTSRAFS